MSCIRSCQYFLLQPFSIAKPKAWKPWFQRVVQYKWPLLCRRGAINEKHMQKMQIPISYLHRYHSKKQISQITAITIGVDKNTSTDVSSYTYSFNTDWNFTVNSFANFCHRQWIYCNLQLAPLLLGALPLLREKSSGKQGTNPLLVLKAQSLI